MELSTLVRRQIDQRVVPTGNFRRAAIAVVAACVLFTGCRSYMPYAGRPLESTAAARKVIYEVLEQQPGGAVLQIEVTDEKFRVAKSRGSGFLGMRSGQTAIYYAHMGDIRLSEKRGVFAVTIVAPNGQPLLHVYSMEQTSAERLIDALETMRRASTMASQVDGR